MSSTTKAPVRHLRLIDCQAARAAASAKSASLFSKRAEEKLRPIFVKAHAGKIRRLLVVYQETEDGPPICVSNEDNIDDAMKMALKGSAMQHLANLPDE